VHFCTIGKSESTSDPTPVSGRGWHVYESTWVERLGHTTPQTVLRFIRSEALPQEQYLGKGAVLKFRSNNLM